MPTPQYGTTTTSKNSLKKSGATVYFSPHFLYICPVTNQPIKVMKRITVKQRLVDYMIASGNNGFTYTEVIKTLLKFRFGDDFKYDHKLHRGYYACSISGINNYMMNGAGKCGLEKRDGRYFARYFDKLERMQRARKEMMRKIQYMTQYTAWYYPLTQEEVVEKNINRLTKNYLRSLKIIKKETAS